MSDSETWEMSADKWEIEAARALARGDEGAARNANRRAFVCAARAQYGVARGEEIADAALRAPMFHDFAGVLGRDAMRLDSFRVCARLVAS